MKVYTIGYGGRRPDELLSLLTAKGIGAVVDVRLRPDRSAVGVFAMAKTADKGIQGLLTGAGIQYFSFVELGNLFRELPDWADRYERMLAAAGDLLTDRLQSVPQPFCLLCAEKRVTECHRRLVGEFLAAKGHQIEHIE
jgi:uncharacterized protein (DUF488 family)